MLSSTHRKRFRRIHLRALFMVVFSITLLSSAPSAHAAFLWGTLNLFGDFVKQMMELAQRGMEGALNQSLKMAAIQTLNSQVGQLIGGSSAGQALFITNYDEFLRQGPLESANLYMNDFFTMTTRGKSSSANYIGVGGIASNVSGGYASYLVRQARLATVEKGGYASMNLEEFTPNPETLFETGDFRGFDAFLRPANNPFGYTLMAEEAYQRKLALETEKARVMAQSSGYLPVMKNGQIVTPAATIEAVVADVSTLGNKVIAAAENPGELMGAVIMGATNRVINNLVQKGIGKVQSNIQKAVNNVNYQTNKALLEANQALGPGAQFIRDVNQRTNVQVNTSPNRQ